MKIPRSLRLLICHVVGHRWVPAGAYVFPGPFEDHVIERRGCTRCLKGEHLPSQVVAHGK